MLQPQGLKGMFYNSEDLGCSENLNLLVRGVTTATTVPLSDMSKTSRSERQVWHLNHHRQLFETSVPT